MQRGSVFHPAIAASVNQTVRLPRWRKGEHRAEDLVAHQGQLVARLDDERWRQLAFASPEHFVRRSELDYAYAPRLCFLDVADDAPAMVVIDNAGVVRVSIDRRVHPVHRFAGGTDELITPVAVPRRRRGAIAAMVVVASMALVIAVVA